ncbi:hypothetical protein ZYGR_0AZ00690 [Zygosaccharomyces rouxii]|uniref:Zn(2)-C6 fungal-type domain-containing protein n=1 Tax=Zygosaccharomyces rouxii TaxID=4956 RepID=A0A1Q3AJJ5_ZYGRO|nr:hypothetical protein ZYGR_0AZ00690 [Zygosaccharomyces rouxii]
MDTKVRYRARRSHSSGTSGKNIVKRTEKRSKSGCLTCRNRKKKCDEIKPLCKGCRRNFLQCIWPEENSNRKSNDENEEPYESSFYNLTMHDMIDELELDPRSKLRTSIPETKEPFIMLHMRKKDKLEMIQKDGSILSIENFPSVEQLSVEDDPSSGEESEETESAVGPDTQFKDLFDLDWIPEQILTTSDFAFNWFTRENINEPLKPPPEIVNPALAVGDAPMESSYNFFYDSNDPLAQKYDQVLERFESKDFRELKEYSKDENFLVYACVSQWLPRMGPQDTHPLLTTAATFTRHFETNYVVKEVFLCCGATFLEWYDQETFRPLSNQLYLSSLTLIRKYLNDNPFYGTEAWLLASYQMLCLRNKTTNTTTVDDCVYCLANSYRIIKATYYEQAQSDSPHLLFIPDKTDQGALHNLSYEIENHALEVDEQVDDVKNHLILQPHERMFLESFIYNYSVAILWADDLTGLPNPFSIFKELSHVLKCPIYHCEFQFMNNPILGAAPDAFEILAKTSYIARFPMPLSCSNVWYKRALQLQSMAEFYTSPVLPGRLKDSRAHESSRLNLHVGRIISKVCYMMLSKIVQFDTYTVVDAQPIVSDVIQTLAKIPHDNLLWGILLWPTVVCGMFATNPQHQQRILDHLYDVASMLHMLAIFETQNFLQTVWLQPIDSRLNALFLTLRTSRVNC